MANQKALVFGGNGFIGSHLVDILHKNGWKIRIYDLFMEKYRDPIPDIEYIVGSFSDTALVMQSLIGIDVVFHLISTTTPGTSNLNPVKDVEDNLIGTIRLLQNCVNARVKKIVFLSSGGAVYGVPLSLPISEMHQTNPESSYGITKLAIEKYFELYFQLYGLEYLILRPSNPYGARQNPYGIQGAISVFLGKIHKNVPIEIWGNGTIVRDYIFIDDLVDGVYKALAVTSGNKIYNLGSGSGYTINEIIGYIKQITQKDPDIRYLPGRIFDPPRIVLDIKEAKKDFFWSPKIQIESGIQKTWDFVRNT